MCFHMPIACTFDWDASLVVSKGAIYCIRRSLILLSVEYCFLRRLSEVYLGSSVKLEMRGIDPRTSWKLSERSTIWATSPLKTRGANAISNLSFIIAIIGQSLLLHSVANLALLIWVINPCVSHMPIVCSSGWHASLVGSKGAVYVREMSLIDLLVQ